MAPSPQASPHVLLAGGGTGGHVFPALAVAEELLRRGWRVSATGMASGLEAELVGRRGLPFHPLAARPLVGKGLLAKAGALATTVRSSFAAARLIREQKVDLVLGTGGYVSAPAVVGARLAGRPALLLEPNAKSGVANRWLSRLAAGTVVAFPETAREFRGKVWVTGVPIRAAFFAVPEALPPFPPPRLLVLGGSLGARRINELVPAAVASLLPSTPGLTVLHQAGARNLEETRGAYARAGVGESVAEIVPFLDDVAGAMGRSHLLISRAGANTVAEICAAGRPAVLLPLAIAQGHQADNARRLAQAEGAEVLLDAEATPERLAAVLGLLLGDGARLQRMAAAARGLANPGAVGAIADRLAELRGGGAR